jgi:hypothetical protein
MHASSSSEKEKVSHPIIYLGLGLQHMAVGAKQSDPMCCCSKSPALIIPAGMAAH